jgi:PRTRC genetic system protein C
MLIANELKRVFKFDNNGTELTLSDPREIYSPDAVLNFYSATYPILTTARIEGPEIINDTVTYHFGKTTQIDPLIPA